MNGNFRIAKNHIIRGRFGSKDKSDGSQNAGWVQIMVNLQSGRQFCVELVETDKNAGANS